MTDTREIETYYWPKPIPSHQFDWTATFDHYDGAEDSKTKWTYDREHGEVLDAHCSPVLYVSASRMDLDDVEGRLGAATKIGRLAAAAPDLAEALEDMLGAHPPISKRIGNEGSPARRAQEDQEAAIAKARAALARAKG